jgi:diguanylate cyclase (GGDEF)-like protein
MVRQTDMEMNKENWDILLERIQYLKEEVRKYKYDYLTGLKMRKDFDGYLKTLYEMYEFEDRTFTLVLVDIDGLHAVNRNEGYGKGDDLIIRVANQLLQSFEGCNGKEVFRIGGDEFAVLIKGFEKEKLESLLLSLDDVTTAYLNIDVTKDYGSPSNVFKIVDKEIISKKAGKTR